MHFLRYVFAGPGCADTREEGADVVCSFADLRGREDDVVVVEVEAERDGEFFAYGEQVMDGPGDVVVFEDESFLDSF